MRPRPDSLASAVTDPLPIETIVPALLEGLRRSPNLVLQAEPGAGKTTHVPRVLMDAGFAADGEILVTAPRRIAARMAAHRVAEMLGEAPGGRCGYQVRFEAKVGPQTRIRFVTEGLLTRRLRSDPDLAGAAMVILDEFHERHLDADLALTLLRRLQRERRPDLRILVMSATLDADPVAAFLDAPALRCPGRTFPISIEHAARTSDRALAVQVADAFRSLLADGCTGSVLAFLPGTREIREAQRACASTATRAGYEVLPLHGELSSAEQDLVTRRATTPRLVLATNIAETSLTIDGVEAVIDSGWVRRASHNPWTGMPTLTLTKISQASANQRAGRAGRTRPGRCLRLYTKNDFDRRTPFDPPEIARLDLASALLDLHAQGLADPRAVGWFEAPPDAAVDAAEELLRRLGAIDATHALTELGRAMLPIPAHPRLARLLVEGARRGILELASRAAALLSERPIRVDATRLRDAAESDLAADWIEVEERRVEPNLARTLRQASEQFRRALRSTSKRALPAAEAQSELCRALLDAFPDRVARRRPGSDVFVFADGGSATLARESVVHHAAWIVALAAEDRPREGRSAGPVIRSAAQIESDWLIEDFSDDIEERVEVRFDTTTERVIAIEELRFGALTIEQRTLSQLPERATEVLYEAAKQRGPAAFVRDPQVLDALRHRCTFAARFDPSVPALDETAIEAYLERLCHGRRRFAELREADLAHEIYVTLPHAALERLAPQHVHLAGGRRLVVHYEPDRDPWVESYLQDFFGLRQGPSIAGGRVPLVLHLLAPNRRAVQVTTDLDGFWTRHYPELRRTLMRRYPRHAWPEDPRTATPPAPRSRGSG